jgi:histone H3/H4
MEESFWRRCSSCKKEIGFGRAYQECEVSNCKKHAFCSVNCWNLHNEVMNHKSAGAIESIAPFKKIDEKIQVSASNTNISEDEILIVASKLKQYIKTKHDLSTSADVLDILSALVRNLTDSACHKAKTSGRKTVMSRDF